MYRESAWFEGRDCRFYMFPRLSTYEVIYAIPKLF